MLFPIPILLLLIIHLFRYKDFYESSIYILIYRLQTFSVSFFKYIYSIIIIVFKYSYNTITIVFKYSYNTITIAELAAQFIKRAPKSHISMKYKCIPEVFQHALSVRNIHEKDGMYYHISKSYQGYDALSFHLDDLEEIINKKALHLVNLHEKKTIRGNFTHSDIKKTLTEYSVPNMEGIVGNRGARPGPVSEVHFKTFFPGDFNKFNYILQKNQDLHSFPGLKVNLDDGSNLYGQIKFNPKGLGNGTTITDEGVEHLKFLYNFLENHEEVCILINNYLEDNPFFPL